MWLFGKKKSEEKPAAKITADEAHAKGDAAYNAKNYTEAVQWWRKAAEQGIAEAQYNLGCMYAEGQGTKKDFAQARYWFQKAADQGLDLSKQGLAKLDALEGKAASKEPARPSKPQPASKPAPAAKAKTDNELCDEGARAYREKNYAAAVQIWLPLAEKGVARAQDCMGLLCYRGDGVEKDEKKSAEWYRKAAEQGLGSSCFNLAIFYERGIGVTKDLTAALHWYERAAEQGDAKAQFNCAISYGKGEGTAVNLEKALFWAEKAKAAGVEQADNLIAEIHHNMEAEEKRKNSSAPKPGGELTPEEQYAKGMELFRAGSYEEAYKLLDKVCEVIYFTSEKGENIYPAGQAALGWMCETGNGTPIDVVSASMYYLNAIDNATGVPDKDGMAGMVRLTAKKEQPTVSGCETALDYAKQLGTDEAKRLLPVLEQKLAKAQKLEKLMELDLNEGNVQAIFNRCLATKESSSYLISDLFPAGLGYFDVSKIHVFEFDEDIILKNKSNLLYLFGQLDCVHKPKEVLTAEDFLKNYLGQNWTSEKFTLMKLLYLGNCSKINLIFPFNARKNNTTRFVSSIKPTLSPKDPAFPAWWEAHKAEWEDKA